MTLTLLALVASSPHVAHADAGSWSTPIPLTGEGKRGWAWFPSIATDRYGDVHVVWAGDDSNGPAGPERIPTQTKRLTDNIGLLLYTRWDGQRWTPPNDIAATTPAGNALRSALVADQSGRLHLIYRGLKLGAPNSGSTEALRYMVADGRAAEQANSWLPGEVMSRRSPTYFPEIAIDGRGTLHAIWTEFDGLAAFGLYYRRSTDGGRTWSPNVVLEEARPVYWARLQFKVDLQDRLHAVWEVMDPGDAYRRAPTLGFVYAQSKDGGGTWAKTSFVREPVYDTRDPISPLRYAPQQPALGFDGKGQILLVWREDQTNTVYFQHSLDGSSWSPALPVPGIERGIDRPYDRYDMATDRAGHTHLVAVGYAADTPRLALLHSEWDGSQWSLADSITRAPLYPEWPRIAVSGGNRLHVVWFVGDVEGIGRTPVGVWYSTRETAAPPLPLEARPTAVPPSPTSTPRPRLASPTPGPVFAIAGQPEAARDPVGDAPRGADDLEGGGIAPLAFSLAAVALLLIGCYGFTRLNVGRRVPGQR